MIPPLTGVDGKISVVGEESITKSLTRTIKRIAVLNWIALPRVKPPQFAVAKLRELREKWRNSYKKTWKQQVIKLNLWRTFRTNLAFFSLIKRFNLRGQQPCDWFWIGLGHQFGFYQLTSSGNTLLKDLKIVSHSQTLKDSLSYFKRLLMYPCSLF